MALSFASATVDPTGKMVFSHNIQSCKRVSAGVYLLTYSSDFRATSGGPQATPFGTGLIAGINIGAVNACEVLLTGTSGTATDGGFTFLAVGAS